MCSSLGGHVFSVGLIGLLKSLVLYGEYLDGKKGRVLGTTLSYPRAGDRNAAGHLHYGKE